VDFKCKFGSATLFSFAPHPRGLCNQHNKQLPVYESVNVSHTPETPIQTQTSFLAMSRSRSGLYKLYVWAPANASCQKCRWCWRLALLPSRCTHQRAAETPPFFLGAELNSLENCFTQKFIYLVLVNMDSGVGKSSIKNYSTVRSINKLISKKSSSLVPGFRIESYI